METVPIRNFFCLFFHYIYRKKCSYGTHSTILYLPIARCSAMRKSSAVIAVDSRFSKRDDTTSVPKGYVALLVGSEAEERILVRLSLLEDPCISSLLETTAQELGYDQLGILRLPCEAEHFQWIVNEVSKAL